MEKLETDGEYVVSVDIGCVPSPSGSGETIIQTEKSTLVAFHAISSSVSPSGTYENLDFALVECEACSLTKFGYPNDEGLHEHPLYHRGLKEVFGVAEVVNSSWAASLGDQMDASARRIWRDQYAKVYNVPENGLRVFNWKHFIFKFK